MTKAVTKGRVSAPARVLEGSAAVLDIITRAARDPAVDIDKMERLMAMHASIVADENKKQFIAAKALARSEMGKVIANRTNDTTHSTFADLEAISDAIDPIYAKHGFSMSFGTDKSELTGHYGITCHTGHSGGHVQFDRADVPSDLAGMKGTPNKTPTHAFGSTMTYGRRYLKLMIWDIAIAREDDDGNAAAMKEEMQPISKEDVIELRKALDELNSPIDRFCFMMQIEDLPSMQRVKLPIAWASINMRRANANAKAAKEEQETDVAAEH